MSYFPGSLRLSTRIPLLGFLFVAAGAGPLQLAAQELPPAIEADRLLLQAERQMQEEDFIVALATLDRIIDLQTQHGLELPAPFWFSHARVAMEAGFAEDSRASAMRYLEVAGREGEHYVEALELLNQTEPLLAQAAESAAPGRVFRDCTACPIMVEIPSGSFTMGSPESESGTDEGPQHLVTIRSPFAVGAYEVTFAEWDACVRGGGCGGHEPDDEGWGRGNRPVVNVSWEDAQAYVEWLSREAGQGYRLLSEAEWEYVARAGTETARYWGESESGQCRYANGSNESAPCSDGYEVTSPVGAFQPNPFGLYDVLGNVWEWTADCWNDSYVGAPLDGSAWRSGDCSLRVLRGGSRNASPDHLRSAFRGRPQAGNRLSGIGFRIARTLN